MTNNFIHPKAKISSQVEIGAFSYIDEDVIIGEGTKIGPNVTIFKGSRIGKNCKIFPGAVIGAEPQDLKFEGEYSTVEIGDNTTIRECATINRGTKVTGTTKIGSNNLIMAYVHVAHDCVIGDHCVLSNATNLAVHVIVEDQFLRIGKHAFVAGGTMLRKDVPPYVLAAKDPAVFAGINSVGLKRRSFSIEEIHLIQDIYRYLFNSGLNTTQAIEKIKEDFSTSFIRDEILDFVKKSERGIIRGIS